jgi:heavy metal translocating P-type ATPase
MTNSAAPAAIEPMPVVTLRQLGRQRVRLSGVEPDSEQERSLLAWMRERAEVASFERLRPGAIELRLVPSAPDAARSMAVLRDQLSVRQRANEIRPDPRVVLVHSLRGRARFRITEGPAALAVRLASLLRQDVRILEVEASLPAGSIVVRYDPDKVSADEIRSIVESCDVLESSATWPSPPTASPDEASTRTTKSKCFFDTLVLAAVWAGALHPLVEAGAVAMSAVPVVGRASRAIAKGDLTIDALDVGAVGIALGTGRASTAALITWLLGVGDHILARTTDRARRTMSARAQLEASHAWRVSDSSEIQKVAVRELQPGDRIAIYPGERIPADGVVVEGAATIDEKPLTGESLPRPRKAGEGVHASTVVIDGQLLVHVHRAGAETTAARIVRMLDAAGSKPMTLQRNAEAAANKLVVPTIALGVAAGALSANLDRLTSVLITDFGSGVRIAVPTAALSALAVAADEGVLVKGGQYLERLARADAIVFDKTGTLTLGEPEVVEVVTLGGRSRQDVLGFAAAAESRHKHPIAKAMRNVARLEGAEDLAAELGSERYTIGTGVEAVVSGVRVLVGRRQMMRDNGLESPELDVIAVRHKALGASSLYVAIDRRVEAVIAYADKPREESAGVVATLRAGGRREVLLMSGDSRGVAEAVAARLGVDRVMSELMPEDKAAHLRALQREGRVVAMVGDGINDAPALALADVGVSLHGGSDVALDTADVVLIDGGLSKLPRAFDLADEAMRQVRTGLALVLVPNLAAMALGALGFCPPALAAVVNNGSTVVAGLAGLKPLVRRRLGGKSGKPGRRSS